MSTDPRLNRLYPALGAHERGMLVLQACKAGETPYLSIYTTMPADQAGEFGRMVRVVNAINVEVAAVIFMVREQVRLIDLRYGWMMTLVLGGIDVKKLGDTVLALTQNRKLRAAAAKAIKSAPGSLTQVPVLSLWHDVQSESGRRTR